MKELALAEASKTYSVDANTIYTWIKKGKVEARKVESEMNPRGKYLVDQVSLRKFLRKREEKDDGRGKRFARKVSEAPRQTKKAIETFELEAPISTSPKFVTVLLVPTEQVQETLKRIMQ